MSDQGVHSMTLEDQESLRVEVTKLRSLLSNACCTIESLAEQQAIPDDFYKHELEIYKAAISAEGK